MPPDELFAIYEELQRYIGWTEEDTRRLQAIRPLIEPLLPDLVEDFYSEIERHPETRRVITGGYPQIVRLRETLKQWLRDLSCGQYDAPYLTRRWQAGLRHVQIGLRSRFAHAALGRLRRGLMDGLHRVWSGDQTELHETLRSLNSLLDLDLAIIDIAYKSESIAREQRAARLAEIAELGRQVLVEDNVDKLMRVVCERTAETLAADACSIWVLSHVGSEFEPRCVVNRGPLLPAVTTIAATGDHHTGFTFRSGFPVVVTDFLSERRFDASSFQQSLNTARSLGVAIRGEVRPIGVIQVDRASARPFEEADAAFLQSIANLLGSFLGRQQIEERARQATRLAAIGQMITGLAHESRNALQRSQACLEMLSLEIGENPQARKLVERIQVAQDHLHHLFEEVRSYAAPLHLRPVSANVQRVWRETWSHLAHLWREKNIRLIEISAGIDPLCEIDSQAVQQVFRNIFDNAITASPDRGEITVTFDAATLGGEPAVRIAIRDNGAGLSLEQRQRIFDPFYTTKIHGTGLGMSIVRRIVEAHSGCVEVGEPLPGSGTEIILFLPRNQI